MIVWFPASKRYSFVCILFVVVIAAIVWFVLEFVCVGQFCKIITSNGLLSRTLAVCVTFCLCVCVCVCVCVWGACRVKSTLWPRAIATSSVAFAKSQVALTHSIMCVQYNQMSRLRSRFFIARTHAFTNTHPSCTYIYLLQACR
jgi:hypothetical protein